MKQKENPQRKEMEGQRWESSEGDTLPSQLFLDRGGGGGKTDTMRNMVTSILRSNTLTLLIGG